MAHTHDFYADWVRDQLLNESPPQWVRKHRDGWRNVLQGVVAASGVFEVPALVISRWEFLGSLFRGNATEDTGCRDAVAYTAKFLTHVNPLYAGVHNLVGRANQQINQSDIFMMYRNKPFHGVHSLASTSRTTRA